MITGSCIRRNERDFPDDLPQPAFFASRPNLRSHCKCQPDNSGALNPSGDLISLHIICQITIFMWLPQEMAPWTLVEHRGGDLGRQINSLPGQRRLMNSRLDTNQFDADVCSLPSLLPSAVVSGPEAQERGKATDFLSVYGNRCT